MQQATDVCTGKACSPVERRCHKPISLSQHGCTGSWHPPLLSQRVLCVQMDTNGRAAGRMRGKADLILQLLQDHPLCCSVLVHDGHCAPAHQRHKLPAHLHAPSHVMAICMHAACTHEPFFRTSLHPRYPLRGHVGRLTLVSDMSAHMRARSGQAKICKAELCAL